MSPVGAAGAGAANAVIPHQVDCLILRFAAVARLRQRPQGGVIGNNAARQDESVSVGPRKQKRAGYFYPARFVVRVDNASNQLAVSSDLTSLACSSAWYEERTSGPDATFLKPIL
jgi:hypothetical protein